MTNLAPDCCPSDAGSPSCAEGNSQLKPLQYESEIVVRFADLDPYGHVNATNYLDYVISGRWLYAKEQLGVTADDFIKKNVGFFMTESRVEYRRSINGVQRLFVTSFVSKIDGHFKYVSFRIQDSDRSKTFCSGELKFAIMDLATMKTQSMPDWVKKYFFYS